MAVTYTWVFSGDSAHTKTIGSNADVITSLDWQLRGTDTVDGETVTATASGNTEIDTSDLSNFVAFADLTQAQVETMAENNMSAAELAHHKQVVADAITNVADGFNNMFVTKPYVEEVAKTLSFA